MSNDNGENMVNDAQESAAVKTRPGHVHFVSFLKTSVPPDTPSTTTRSINNEDPYSSERAPLLGSDDDPELAGIDSDPDDDDENASSTRITCTPRGVLVTILVLLAITGVCIAAVFLRVGSKKSRPPSF